MDFSNNQMAIKISKLKVLAISLGVQVIANLFFGLPLMAIVFINFPFPELKKAVFLYLALYTFIYIPLYSILPFVLLSGINRFLKRYYRKEKIKLEAKVKAIENALNSSLNIGFWVGFISLLGFVGGLVIAKWGGFFEISIGLRETITILSIGLVVAIVQGWLNYIFFERLLRPIIQFLVRLYPQISPTELKVRKLSVFLRYFIIGIIGVIISQIALFAFSYQEFITYLPPSAARIFFLFQFLIGGLVFGLVFTTTFLAAQNFSDLFKRLIRWTKKIAAGHFEEVVDIRTTDEISTLAFSLEQMRQKLKRVYDELEESKETLEIRVKARTKELEQLAESLDEQVKQRTKELQEKVKELEKFQKLAVGRELKMIELKEEIKKLEKLLKSKSK